MAFQLLNLYYQAQDYFFVVNLQRYLLLFLSPLYCGLWLYNGSNAIENANKMHENPKVVPV